MKRKFVGGLLISLFVLCLLVILSLFIPFGKIAYIIYSLFFIELFFFAWLYTRKVTAKLFFRHFIGFTIISFFLLLAAQILSFFAPKATPSFIYYLFAIDVLVLITLYLRKVLKREATVFDKIGYAASILIPLIIIGYVVYMNWLPFGFEKTYVLDVGVIGDTTVTNEIYLEKSDAVSEPMQEGERTFRELEGSTNIIFKPKAVLKDATINITLEGENVIPTKFKPLPKKWNLSVDFSKGIPDFLEGNAEFTDGCAYFDGQSSLNYPNTHDQFEEGPFAVYVEWTPKNDNRERQQIIGHYNWELWHEENAIVFLVGRMNDITGKFYSIYYPTNPDFFNKKHFAWMFYNPSEKGYIELFVDGNFAERKNIGNSTIWKEYNDVKPLSFGKSSHGSTKYYIGCIHKAIFSYESSYDDIFTKINSFYTSDEILKIPIIGNGKIYSVEIKVKR